ncbi:hypothetical protein QYE76_030930 [Lolium multiflorum]|uniref:F-box domain-containing protein n=1 Tax=Lolium multiflorum TaxID=4521 RepID=A0AAD8QT53_LOLMU|nr:hypothetical protein QYE76_030930 [Lolium multiflorum]
MGVDFSTDVLAHILVLLPPSSRRQCRLVCKHWRYAVDERTHERFVRTKILAVVKAHDRASAFVVDEARGVLGGHLRRVWTGPLSANVIGTRNGLICVLDDATGAITVSNPHMREAAVTVPPAPRAAGLSPCSPAVRAHEAYGFGFHPLTLRYTVVHVPCYFNKSGTFDAVQVYTLGPSGGASWREVPTPGASGRCQQGGVVCVDGSAYWITRGARETILSLDLEDWRVAPVKWLPGTLEQVCSYRLTEMRARLCVAVTVGAPPTTRVEVWCLENTKEQQWARRYNIQIDTAKQQVTWPLFAHGEHALTMAQEFHGYSLRKHKMSGKRSLMCSMARVWKKRPGAEIMRYEVRKKFEITTFAYMETPEELLESYTT